MSSGINGLLPHVTEVIVTGGKDIVMPKSLGRLIKQLRERESLSQHALSRMAGIDPAIISRLESGDRDSVRFETLCRISVALGVSLDDLAAALGLISGGSDLTFAGAERVRISDQILAVQRLLLKAQEGLDEIVPSAAPKKAAKK